MDRLKWPIVYIVLITRQQFKFANEYGIFTPRLCLYFEQIVNLAFMLVNYLFICLFILIHYHLKIRFFNFDHVIVHFNSGFSTFYILTIDCSLTLLLLRLSIIYRPRLFILTAC